jgi:dihydrofolate reductase
MRKLTVITHVTLDGVMQAPGRPDEDTRGGFGRGGWAQAGNDQVMADFMGVGRGGDPVALLLGRRTYQDFFGFWPHQPDNPYTESLTKQQKYVASRTLAEPLPWQNSTVLPGDAASAVAALKQEPGPDLLVLGSGELVGSLRPARPGRRVRADDPPAHPRPGAAAVPGGRPPPTSGWRKASPPRPASSSPATRRTD